DCRDQRRRQTRAGRHQQTRRQIRRLGGDCRRRDFPSRTPVLVLHRGGVTLACAAENAMREGEAPAEPGTVPLPTILISCRPRCNYSPVPATAGGPLNNSLKLYFVYRVWLAGVSPSEFATQKSSVS